MYFDRKIKIYLKKKKNGNSAGINMAKLLKTASTNFPIPYYFGIFSSELLRHIGICTEFLVAW